MVARHHRLKSFRLIHIVVALLFGLQLAPAIVNTAVAQGGITLSVDAGADNKPINPDIYGMNYPNEELAAELRLPVQRWGGNSTTRYNYMADVSNRGADWYFQNVPESNPAPASLPAGSSADQFIERGYDTGSNTLMTIPIIGWVARPDSSRDHPYACGFSIKKYGGQQSFDSFDPDCGNGRRGDGSNVAGNDPNDTSIPVDPEFMRGWMQHLVATFGRASAGGVRYYNLDNEPSLWQDNHRDIRTEPLGYAELRDRSFAYGAVIKSVDPTAQILGPAEWGWNAYFYSARDSHSNSTNPDRAQFDNKPLVQWYLEQMRAYEQQNNQRLLDYLDLHYYPQASGVALSGAGNSATQQLRLRSTRSLWDPSYSDESWIASQPDGPAVRLIPRMRDWVNTYYPGTKLAIGEYNWGALDHINGALAQADVLGIYGREGLDMAMLWDPPTANQPGAYAFRMFLNYDGKGARFGNTSVRASSSNQDQLAIYAARRSGDYALTLMVVNKSDNDQTAPVNVAGFQPASTAKVFRYSEANLGAVVQQADMNVGASFNATFPKRSITLIVLDSTTKPTFNHTVFLPIVTNRSTGGLRGDDDPTPAPNPSPNPSPSPNPNPSPSPNPPSEPVAGTVRIMPLGDSITEGVNGGYRVGLWNKLTADGYKLDYVGPRYDQWANIPDKDHAGTPGFTTGGIIDNIDGWMDGYKPQVVLLMIGVNDLAWWTVEGPDAVSARVGTILDKIKAKSPNTYVVVATITPMKGTAQPNGADRNQLATNYNNALKQLVASRAGNGDRVYLADVNSAVSVSDLYDDVHPNEAGHAKIATVWYNAVKPLLAK